MKYSYQSRGFTLLEVMIALVLLASIAASVVQVISRGVDSTLTLEHESTAYLLAESKMDELLLLADVREGAGAGVFAGDGDYRYQVEVNEQPYEGQARSFELMHIGLTVRWGETSDNAVVLEALKTQAKPL